MLSVEETELKTQPKETFDTPLVSVYMTTYNQENYIAQAIESIVMQKCNFNFELVIGEDCSTDNTRSIVKKYAEMYPDIIKTILHEKNVGGKQNGRAVFTMCSGKYLAFCEGDDFWVSPYKLQKQVDLIESDENIKAVFTQVKWVDRDNNELGFSDNSDNKTGRLDYKKLLQVNPIHTCAFLLDQSVYTDAILQIRKKAPYGDYVMFLAASFYGKVAFIDEVMAAYRRDVGVMHKWSAIESGLKRLQIFDLFQEQTEFKKMNFYIKIAKQYLCIHMSRHYSDEKNYIESIKYYLLALYYTGYVLLAKKDEMHRKVSVSEFIKTGIFSFPYVKVIYRKIKRIS